MKVNKNKHHYGPYLKDMVKITNSLKEFANKEKSIASADYTYMHSKMKEILDYAKHYGILDERIKY